MNRSLFKKKCADAWENTYDTLKYAVCSPLSFTASAVSGMALLAAELISDKKPMPRLHDDLRKRCAIALLTGLMVLYGVGATYKGIKENKAKNQVPQNQLPPSVRLEGRQ